MLKWLWCGAVLLFAAQPAGADVTLGLDFKDGMTLPRRKTCLIWGTAKYKEKVTLSFRGKTASAVGAPGGAWKIEFDGGEPGGPFPLVVEGANRIEFKQVYVPDVAMPPIFTEEMVLQQGKQTPVFGWAPAGKTVKITFRGKTYSAAAEDGSWRTTIDTGEPGGPFPLLMESVAKTRIENVYVGEVWLVSGQSNAGSPLGKPVEEQSGIIRMYSDPGVRLKTVDGKVVKENGKVVQEDPPGAWVGRAKFPIIAWYFAKKLLERRKTPTGIVQAARGGTRIHEWIPAALPPGAIRPRVAGGCYKTFIDPVISYGIKGIVWWQGESDMKAGYIEKYSERIYKMIPIWRENWGQGDLPFILVQLQCMTEKAPWVGKDVAEGNLPVMREAQRSALTQPNTGMVVTCDFAAGVHPSEKDKEQIGERLVMAAEALAYGKKVEWSGPLFDRAVVQNGRIVISFGHVGEGLLLKDPAIMKNASYYKKPVPDSGEAGRLRGFEIQSGGGDFVPAQATLSGKTVVIDATDMKAPFRVRYAWAAVPDGNLFNRAGLPASVFDSGVLESGR